MSFLKKYYLIAMVMLGLGGSVSAQQTVKNIAVLANEAASANVILRSEVKEEVANKSINMLADYPNIFRQFIKSYPDGADPQWAESGGFLFVSFVNNGNRTRACFTREGDMNYAISQINLEEMPGSLKRYIKSNYPAHEVFNAIKIDACEKVSYQVILESDAEYITVKSTREGIEESSRIGKSEKP